MKNQQLIILLTFLCISMGCKDNNSSEEPTEIEETVLEQNDTSKQIPEVETSKMLYAWVDLLRVREFPNSKSDVLIKVPEGDSLTFLGEETLDKMKVTLRGKVFDEPWLKVKTDNNTIGWVYGGGVTNVAPPGDRSPTPFDKCYVLKNKYWALDNECMKQRARKELREDQRFVTKRNTELIFNLLGGDFKSFKNNRNTNTADYVDYTYFYYIKKMGFFVLQKGLQEGKEYLLVNDKTGEAIAIPGFPKVAPNGKRLVVTNPDLGAGFDYNGIQIWSLGDKGLELEWENELANLEPFYPKWYDNRTIQITLQQAPHETSKEEPTETYIRLGENGEWEME